MATEASFTLPTEEFPVERLFESFPEARIELERLVPMGTGIVPYVWVRGVDDDLEVDQCTHPAVTDVHVVDRVDDNWLLRVGWAAERRGLLRTLEEMDLPLLEAVGTKRHWRFAVRGDSQSDIASFQERCRDLQIPISVTNVRDVTHAETGLDGALTDAQRRAIVLAYRAGYFEFPREVTMAELGAELGISQQAFANRLWRGIDRLLEHALEET